jgi:hypothetical protein
LYGFSWLRHIDCNFKWPGPIIEANSFEEADEWCKKNTQYLFVEQEVIEVRKDANTGRQLN